MTVTNTLTVGRASGDRATVTVGDDGQIWMGRLPLTIGGPDGAGLVTLGGRRPNGYADCDGQSYDGDNAHLFCGDISVPADATAASGVLDIIRLDANGMLTQTQGSEKIRNLSPDCDARILFNGGNLTDSNGWGAAKRFSSTAGRALVFESVDGNPIMLRYRYGSLFEPTEGQVKTAGDGAVVVHSSERGGNHYGWRLAASHFAWGHRGDLRLSSYMCCVCTSENALPCLEDGGDVVLDGANRDNWLDLNGTSQAVNGLLVGAASVLSNGVETAATLKFGLARPDGVLNAPVIHGRVDVEKVGTGTLTVTNTPMLGTLAVAEGRVRFVPSTRPVTLSALTVAAGAEVVVNGVTVSAQACEVDAAATVTLLNGGQLVLAADADDGARTFIDGGKMPDGTRVEKTGGGTAFLIAPDEAAPKDIHVRDGILACAARGTTNEFWRVTIKEPAVAGVELNLGPFRLYGADGDFCDGGVPLETGYRYSDIYKNVSSSTPPSGLSPLNVMFSSTKYMAGEDWQYKKHGSDNQTVPWRAMFACATVWSCRFNFAPLISDPATWLVVTYRLPALNGKVVAGYNVKSQWDEPTKRFPGAWCVEASPSGEEGTWEVVDEQIGQMAPNGQSWYRKTPYPVISDRPGAGFPAAVDVRVDAGATLDCSRVEGRQEISCLTIDLTAGGGVLKGVRLVPAGTLNVVGTIDGIPTGTLPLTFSGSTTNGSLAGWTVLVNGNPVNRYLVWQGDALALVRGGMAVILR